MPSEIKLTNLVMERVVVVNLRQIYWRLFYIVNVKIFNDLHLLVGNETNDDAAVYDLGNGVGIISTTDFLCQ